MTEPRAVEPVVRAESVGIAVSRWVQRHGEAVQRVREAEAERDALKEELRVALGLLRASDAENTALRAYLDELEDDGAIVGWEDHFTRHHSPEARLQREETRLYEAAQRREEARRLEG